MKLCIISIEVILNIKIRYNVGKKSFVDGEYIRNSELWGTPNLTLDDKDNEKLIIIR